MDPKAKQEVADAIQRVLSGDVDSYELVLELTDSPLRSFIGSRYGRQDEDFVNEVSTRTHEYALVLLCYFLTDWYGLL